MRHGARVLSGLGVVLLAAAAASSQEGSKPQLSVYAETYKFNIPGLEKLPPEARAALGSAAQAQRNLRVQFWSPGAPPASPSANLDIPAGLQLGKTLPLEIPKGGDETDPTSPNFKFPKGYEKFEFHRYWGCSATVKPGQPKVVKGASITAEQAERAAKAAKAAGGKAPSNTYAYWPNNLQKMPPKLETSAAMPGGYQLKTNYAGGVAFQVPDNVNFLAPVDLTVDGSDLSKAATLSWKPVPNAVGYYAMAMGTKGENIHVMWISSEVPDGFDQGFQTTGEVQALVQKGVYMPPSKTQCTIPAGIFQGCKAVSVQVMAYGPSFTQGNTTPSVRVYTQSTAMATLGQGLGGAFVPGDRDDDE